MLSYIMATKDDLIAELKAWCEAERGRRSRVAEHLGVSRFAISNWLSGRRTPSLDEGFRIQEFLKKQKRKERRLDKRNKSAFEEMDF
jgi:predicted transcriptional regulator